MIVLEGYNKENRLPWDEFDIMRGGGGGLFAKPETCIGKLKARCRVYMQGSTEHLEDQTLEDQWAQLGRDKKIQVRLYLIRGEYSPKPDPNPNPNS